MLDKDKIETQLKGKLGDQCVVFAVRAAMRVLPLLTTRKKRNSKVNFDTRQFLAKQN